MRRIGQTICTLLVAVACSHPGPTTSQGTARALFAVEGQQGLIQVVDSEGVRTLVIDGAVHAAAPVLEGRVLPTRDPMVELLDAIWRGRLCADGLHSESEAVTSTSRLRKRALVIGLGSGQTAANLLLAGFDVEAVELEPAVIDVARRFFGYNGHAVAADGLTFLESVTSRYDLVLMDAFAGTGSPEHLVSKEAFKLMHGALRDDLGVVAVRLLGSPGEPRVREIRGAMRSVFNLVFGSGIGDEAQNLYLLSSRREMNFTNGDIRGLFAVTGPEGRSIPLASRPVPADLKNGVPAPVPVQVFGYLTRDTLMGKLCVDLPWYEMGAIRYVLSGSAAKRLERMLSEDAAFPTLGGIPSDGDLGGTLFELLGGGGCMRCGTRFSPVVVVVEGYASVRAVLHPDRMPGHRQRPFGPSLEQPQLGWGGVLYNLDVQSVPFTLTHEEMAIWRQSELAPVVTEIATALSKNRFVEVGALAASYVGKLSHRLKGYAKRTVLHREMSAVAECCAEGQGEAKADATAYEAGLWCDRRYLCLTGMTRMAHAASIRAAFEDCAVRNYRRVLAGSDEGMVRRAASRLLFVLEDKASRKEEGAQQLTQETKSIRSRFGPIEPAEVPTVP